MLMEKLLKKKEEEEQRKRELEEKRLQEIEGKKRSGHYTAHVDLQYTCVSWYSICLERRTSWVRVPPEAALLFLLGKKELSSGVVACICLVSITDYTCTCNCI